MWRGPARRRLAAMALVALAACSSAPETEPDWFDGGPMKPTSVRTLQMTTRVLAAKGDRAGAGQVAARMLAEYPQHAESYVEAAELLVQDGRYKDAAAVLTAGIGRLPGNPVLHNDRGLCRLMLGQLADATADFEAAYAVDSYDSDYVANLALVRALAGDEAEAQRLWLRVLPANLVDENLQKARSARATLGA
jgi:tetratricopeptide (TPR) repeat protein